MRPPALSITRSSVSGGRCERCFGSSRPDQARPKIVGPSPPGFGTSTTKSPPGASRTTKRAAAAPEPGRARDRERAARAAPDVEIATGTDPRRAAPPDPPEHSPRPEPRRERYARVAERAVAEAVGERPPRGALTALRALQRHPRRRLLMPRIVIGVTRGQMLVAHARSLVEKAAGATAHDGVVTGDGEGAILRRPDRVGGAVAADRAGSLDGRQRRRQRKISSMRLTARLQSKVSRMNAEPAVAIRARSPASAASRSSLAARSPTSRRRATSAVSSSSA